MVLKSSRACMTKSIVSTIRLSTSFKTALYLTYQLAREYNISRLSLLTYPPDSTFWPFVIRRVAFSMPENFLHFRVSETEIQAVRKGLHCPDFQADGKEKSPESLGITGAQDFSFWF